MPQLGDALSSAPGRRGSGEPHDPVEVDDARVRRVEVHDSCGTMTTGHDEWCAT